MKEQSSIGALKALTSNIYSIVMAVLMTCCALPAVAQTAASAEEQVAIIREKLESGDYNGSFQYIDEALMTRSFEKPFSPVAWAEVVGLKAQAYSQKYDWQKAIKVGLDAYTMLFSADPKLKSSKTFEAVYSEILYRLSTYYAGRGRATDYSKAIRFALMARDNFSKKSRLYFACTNDLALYYLMVDNVKEARNMAKDAVKIGADVYADDKDALAKILWEKSQDMAEIEEYDMAITYSQACIALFGASEKVDSLEHVRRLTRLAGYYFQERDFPNEIFTLHRAEPIASELGQEGLTENINVLRKLALAYNHRANEIKEEKDKKLKEEFKEDMSKYEHYENVSRELLIQANRYAEIRREQLPLVSNTALDFFNAGELQQAVKYESIACQLNEQYGDKFGLAHSCSNLATFYAKIGDDDNCLKYGTQAVDLYDDIEENTLHKQLAYNNVALYMHNNGMVEDAIKYGLKSIEVIEALGDSVSDIHARALANLSVYYAAIGETEKAAEYSKRSASMKVASLKKSNEDAREMAQAAIANAKGRKNKKAAREAANNLVDKKLEINTNLIVQTWNIAMNAHNNGNIEALTRSYGYVLAMLRRYQLDKYPDLTTEERRKDWDNNKAFYDFANIAAYSYADNDSLAMCSFDALLAEKHANAIIATPDSQHIMRTWKTVQEQLSDDEAIVWFFTTPVEGNVLPHSALLLRKGWDAPKSLAPLYNKSNILNIDFFIRNEDGSNTHTFLRDIIDTPEGLNTINTDSRVGDFIWGNILQTLGTSSLKTIRLHTAGYLDTLDPTRLTIEGEKQVNTLYKFVKD